MSCRPVPQKQWPGQVHHRAYVVPVSVQPIRHLYTHHLHAEHLMIPHTECHDQTRYTLGLTNHTGAT